MLSLKGEKGEKGDQGIQGEQGQQGIQGIQGEQGPQGIQGEKGLDGKSAYQIAVEKGYEGDETAWLASLKGPQGIQGEQGPQGIQGPQGEKGEAASRTVKTSGYPSLAYDLNIYKEESDDTVETAEVKIVESLEQVKALAEEKGFVQSTILFNLVNSASTTQLQMVYNGESIGEPIGAIKGQSFYKINIIAIVINNILNIDIEINTTSRITVSYEG